MSCVAGRALLSLPLNMGADIQRRFYLKGLRNRKFRPLQPHEQVFALVGSTFTGIPRRRYDCPMGNVPKRGSATRTTDPSTSDGEGAIYQ